VHVTDEGGGGTSGGDRRTRQGGAGGVGDAKVGDEAAGGNEAAVPGAISRVIFWGPEVLGLCWTGCRDVREEGRTGGGGRRLISEDCSGTGPTVKSVTACAG